MQTPGHSLTTTATTPDARSRSRLRRAAVGLAVAASLALAPTAAVADTGDTGGGEQTDAEITVVGEKPTDTIRLGADMFTIFTTFGFVFPDVSWIPGVTSPCDAAADALKQAAHDVTTSQNAVDALLGIDTEGLSYADKANVQRTLRGAGRDLHKAMRAYEIADELWRSLGC